MSARIKRRLAVGAAVVLGAISALAAPIALGETPEAGAADEYSPCSDPWIEQAIFNATGEHTGQVSGAGLACNPFLYNKARWGSQSELQGYVNEVLNRCGNTTQGRYIVLALLETTGIPPKSGVEGLDNVCHPPVYDRWWEDHEGYESPGVDWTKYYGGAYPSIDVFGAVSGTMSVCNNSAISHAVVSVIDRYPITNPAGLDPNHHVTSNLGVRGQCDPGLYRNGTWTSYDDLKQRVIDRAYSQTICTHNEVQAAMEALTGWRPLSEECVTSRYNNGSWGSLQELVNRAYHALRCSEPWLGQFIAYDIASPRQVRGRGWAVGECQTLLYRNSGSVFVSFSDFRAKVQSVHGKLVARGVTIESDGDVNVDGKEYDGGLVRVGSTAGAPGAGTLDGTVMRSSSSTGLLKLVTRGGSGIISTDGSSIISTDGSSIISTDGSSIISDNGGGLIGQAGGN